MPIPSATRSGKEKEEASRRKPAMMAVAPPTTQSTLTKEKLKTRTGVYRLVTSAYKKNRKTYVARVATAAPYRLQRGINHMLSRTFPAAPIPTIHKLFVCW